jgi:hypothetical protein
MRVGGEKLDASLIENFAGVIGLLLGAGAVLGDVDRQAVAPGDVDQDVAKRLGVDLPADLGAAYVGGASAQSKRSGVLGFARA